MKAYFDSYFDPKVVYTDAQIGAIKELQEDDFSDFFYHCLYDDIDSEDGHNGATILLIRGDRDTVQFLEDKISLEPFDDFMTDDKVKRARAVVKEKRKNNSYTGFYPGIWGVTYRPPRLFSGERERQLLKQLSTILFFVLKADGVSPIEIEAMHLRIGTKSFLFITGNKADITAELIKAIPNKKTFYDALTEDSTIAGDVEGNTRVTRYRGNFRARIFGDKAFDGEDAADLEHFSEVRELLRLLSAAAGADCLKELSLPYRKSGLTAAKRTEIKGLLDGDVCIVFVNTHAAHPTYAGRHAEEFLVDIAEVAKEKADTDGLGFYTCVGGKKRPCMTCYGRMKSSGIVTNYGGRPGLVWLDALKHQSEAAAKESMYTLLTEHAHITAADVGGTAEKTDYDSGTDTEYEP